MLEGIQVYIVCIKANFVTTSNMVLYMANYDELILKKYVAKSDWQQHNRRCFELILDDFQPLLSNVDAVFDDATVTID